VQRRTGVRVELLEAEAPELVTALKSRALHAALVYREPAQHLDLGADYDRTHLLDDPFLVVLPADHRCAGLERVPIADLADDAWVMSHQHDEPSDRALLGAAAAAGFTPRAALRTDDYDVAFGFVAAGVAVALVPRLALVDRPGVVVRALDGPRMVRSVELARPVEGTPPVVDVLLAALRRAVAAQATHTGSP
jgi:DNA-binding transcriptional LysR family regulator